MTGNNCKPPAVANDGRVFLPRAALRRQRQQFSFLSFRSIRVLPRAQTPQHKHPVFLYGSHSDPRSLRKVLPTTRLQITAGREERKDILHYSFFKKNTLGTPGTVQLESSRAWSLLSLIVIQHLD